MSFLYCIPVPKWPKLRSYKFQLAEYRPADEVINKGDTTLRIPSLGTWSARVTEIALKYSGTTNQVGLTAGNSRNTKVPRVRSGAAFSTGIVFAGSAGYFMSKLYNDCHQGWSGSQDLRAVHKQIHAVRLPA